MKIAINQKKANGREAEPESSSCEAQFNEKKYKELKI